MSLSALAAKVLRRARKRGWLIATAESCTGGLFAHKLTNCEGLSHHFERGFVVYTEAAKIEMLGVSAATLAAHTDVSREVAAEMAAGALSRSQAHIAIAVTGFAGPAGPGDPPGLVYIAIARRDAAIVSQEFNFESDDRRQICRLALFEGLKMLSEAIGDDG